MSKLTKDEQNLMSAEWYERTHKNWRAWGSWFSWGSPVGLGLFLYRDSRRDLDPHPGVLAKNSTRSRGCCFIPVFTKTLYFTGFLRNPGGF